MAHSSGEQTAGLDLLVRNVSIIGVLVVLPLTEMGCTSSVSGQRDGSAIEFSFADRPTADSLPGDLRRADLSADGESDTTVSDGFAPTPDASGSGCPNGWCQVPAGSSIMGSPAGEGCRKADERQHTVRLTNNFAIGEKEVTRADFERVMGKENMPVINWQTQWAKHLCLKDCYNKADREACSADCPIGRVGWHLAAAYCNQLTLKELASQCQVCVGSGASRVCHPADPSLCQCYSCTGTGTATRCTTPSHFQGSNVYGCPGFRLPTEAEWEFAYRGGTSGAFYNGDITTCEAKDDPNAMAIGWYKQNAYKNIGPNLYHSLHPGGGKAANAYGIYDMAGNRSEWTHSWYKAYPDAQEVTNPNPQNTDRTLTQRVMRGGHVDNLAGSLRAAHREALLPTIIADQHGFRCARSLFQ